MMAEVCTIVVPVYNRSDVVCRTLDSVKAQTYRPIHLIVVDNDSTDASLFKILGWAGANQCPDFKVTVISESKKGAASARNTGLRETGENWLMYFDSDDTMHPDHVESAMRTAADNPDAHIVGWDVALHKDKRVITLPFCTNHPIFRGIINGTMSTQRYMARASVFKLAGRWNERLSTWDDIELGTRILLLPSIKLTKRQGKPKVDVYVSEDSITGLHYHDRAKESELALDTIKEYLPQQLKCIVQLKRAILAAEYYKEGHRNDSKKLIAQACGECKSLWHKFVIKCAYLFTAAGGRGAARICRPLLNIHH